MIEKEGANPVRAALCLMGLRARDWNGYDERTRRPYPEEIEKMAAVAERARHFCKWKRFADVSAVSLEPLGVALAAGHCPTLRQFGNLTPTWDPVAPTDVWHNNGQATTDPWWRSNVRMTHERYLNHDFVFTRIECATEPATNGHVTVKVLDDAARED